MLLCPIPAGYRAIHCRAPSERGREGRRVLGCASVREYTLTRLGYWIGASRRVAAVVG